VQIVGTVALGIAAYFLIANVAAAVIVMAVSTTIGTIAIGRSWHVPDGNTQNAVSPLEPMSNHDAVAVITAAIAAGLGLLIAGLTHSRIAEIATVLCATVPSGLVVYPAAYRRRRINPVGATQARVSRGAYTSSIFWCVTFGMQNILWLAQSPRFASERDPHEWFMALLFAFVVMMLFALPHLRRGDREVKAVADNVRMRPAAST
jgi:hypothetical protein